MASERFKSILAAKQANRNEPLATPKTPTPFSQSPIQSTNGKASPAALPAGKNAAARPRGEFDEVTELHERAVQKMKAGAIAEAVPLLRRVVDLRPRNPDFQNQLAVALQSDGKVDEAIKCYQRSLELQPGRHQVWTNLAQAWLKLGNTTEAKTACGEALKRSPKSAPAQ